MIVKLSVNGLSFRYDSADVLRGLSLDVGDSRVVSVVGPNGSGKSTLIKCIDRILDPAAGTIRVDRRDLSAMDRMELARTVAYVPQSALRVFPHTVFDVVLMGRRPHLGWLGSGDDDEKVWHVLRVLGLEDLALASFTELSGGQQQKVLIARALVQETGVVLLDEPTSNLDLWHQLDVMEVLRSLVRSRRLAAVIAIHDLNIAARYSDQIVMMKKGKIVAAGPPEEVLNEENISSVYGIRARVRVQDDVPYVVPLERVPKKKKN